MKRFLLFTGSTYYPSGGWHDAGGVSFTSEPAFEFQHDTLEAAIKEGRRFAKAEDYFRCWWHVVDLEQGKIVWLGNDAEDREA